MIIINLIHEFWQHTCLQNNRQYKDMGLQARPTWYCTFCNTKQWFRRQKQNVKEKIPYFYQWILLNSMYDTEPLHLIQSSTGFINKTMCEGNHPLSLVRVLWLLTKSTPKISISNIIISVSMYQSWCLCAFFGQLVLCPDYVDPFTSSLWNA